MQVIHGCLIFLTLHRIVEGLFDPVTISAAAGVGLSAYGFNFIKDQTYCRLNECCNDRSIPGNTEELSRLLQTSLFGQHIVIKNLVPALEAHFEESKSQKPLVLSFHGTPGTGKNYVADMIAKTLYTHGLESKFVHKYLGRADFSVASKTDQYNERVKSDVLKAIADCPRSLFIFDEVDQMPTGVFESLTSLVDHHSRIHGNDMTKAIFVFLSNSAGTQIADRLGEMLKKGMFREDARLADFEQTLQMATYNLPGGMQKSRLIEARVIDHFLPFLPLQKEHVYKCIEAEFRRWDLVPSSHTIESLMSETITYEPTFGIFSTTGCKGVEKKIAIEVKRKGDEKERAHSKI